MRKRKLIIFILCTFISKILYADSDIDAHPSQNNGSLKVSGYLNTSYNYLLRNNKFISGTFDRVYDLEENGFTLQQATVILQKKPIIGFGGFLSMVLGRDANEIAPDGIHSNIFGIQNIGFTPAQAFLSYHNESGVLKIGEMSSLAGLESYNYTRDINFSRSIVDGYAQPGTHIGIRGIKYLTNKISLVAGLGNGWSTVKKPLQQDTIELALIFTYPNFSFNINGYTGPEHLIDNVLNGPSSWRNVIDLFGTVKITEKLKLAFNYDYGFQNKSTLTNDKIGKAIWQGIATYFNYQLTEKIFTSIRAEIFSDGSGYRTGVKQTWEEITFTLGFIPMSSLEIRVETRHDFSNANAFLAKNGIQTSNNQQSYALDMLYKFE